MITVAIDGKTALAKFSPAGIPEQVRRNLRMAIPGLLRELAAEVNSNLGQLQSRKRVQIDKGQGVMIENATGVTGFMQMIWTGDQAQSMVPEVLESGAKPHVIEAVNANALAFMWPQIGGMAFFKRVNHPGFAGIHYMENAFNKLRPQIVETIEAAVVKGAQE
jgi:hypothetical protein